MPILLATWIAAVAAAYLGLGLLFAVPFALRWVGRVDPAAGRGSWGFRALIVPGAMLLWPVLLARLVGRVTAPPEERNAHRQAARTQARNPR